MDEGVNVALAPRIFSLNFVRKTPPNPTELRNSDAVQEMQLDQVESAKDARYDAMTDAQRDAYYVNPSLKKRVGKLFGRG